jgi:thiol-disulfide isomerase/thioredoxin
MLIATIVASCISQSPANYTILSGEIKNYNSRRILIVDNSQKIIKEIKASENGFFLDTMFNANGYFTFKNGPEKTSIYLKDSYNIKLKIDANKFGKTIVYTGKGSEINNYLAQKRIIQGEYDDIYKSNALNEKEFVLKLNNEKEALKKILDNSLDENFVLIEKGNIKYEYLSKIVSYNNRHKYLTAEYDFILSDTLSKIIKEVDYTNEEHFKKYMAYKKLVVSNYHKVTGDRARKEDVPFEFTAIGFIKKIKSQIIRNHLISTLHNKIKEGNPLLETLYNDIISISTDSLFKEKLTEKYNIVKRLNRGEISPKFTAFENNTGGTSSLDDFKGKYLFIDVWATWCAPCNKEIPYLKKIEKQYHDKNIEFIGISVDKKTDYDRWKKMISNKKMTGIQLFTGNGWETKFVKDYEIKGIPRFILIDPQGNIISADAPRPSEEKLIELFNEVGI